MSSARNSCDNGGLELQKICIRMKAKMLRNKHDNCRSGLARDRLRSSHNSLNKVPAFETGLSIQCRLGRERPRANREQARSYKYLVFLQVHLSDGGIFTHYIRPNDIARSGYRLGRGV